MTPEIENKNHCEQQNPKSYGFWNTVLIVLAGHLGVRTTEQRKEDFERANGVHVFTVTVMYFLLVIIALIVLVNHIQGNKGLAFTQYVSRVANTL